VWAPREKRLSPTPVSNPSSWHRTWDTTGVQKMWEGGKEKRRQWRKMKDKRENWYKLIWPP
jgi:hypothetical protein